MAVSDAMRLIKPEAKPVSLKKQAQNGSEKSIDNTVHSECLHSELFGFLMAIQVVIEQCSRCLDSMTASFPCNEILK